MEQNTFPLAWNQAALAIIPGLLATMGLVTTDFSTRMLAGLIILVTFLVAGFWWNHRQVPGWSLMAAGMLISICLVLTYGLIGGLAAIVTGNSANIVVLLMLLTITVILLRTFLQQQLVSRVVWVLVAFIIMCQLAMRIKYFVLQGVSWSVAGQWLIISMYAAVTALLFPVVLGLPIAKRYGQMAMLFATGMVYVNFQLLIDVHNKVSSYTGNTLGFIAYKGLVAFLFTVIAPLWFLRARSTAKRVGGLLFLVGSAVIMNLWVVGVSYAGQLPLIIWLSFIPYTLSILLTLVLAYLLYKDRMYAQGSMLTTGENHPANRS